MDGVTRVCTHTSRDVCADVHTLRRQRPGREVYRPADLGRYTATGGHTTNTHSEREGWEGGKNCCGGEEKGELETKKARGWWSKRRGAVAATLSEALESAFPELP